MADQVTDNPARQRFELTVDGHTAFTAYALAGDVITFTHTVVPKELAGRGVGSTLARGALDNVRARHLKVIAECPFIAAYIAKHDEFADLLA
jgi:predicted GNAT family acetyltransferase